MKMKERKSQLKDSLGNLPNVEQIKESVNVPEYDTVNRQGFEAYSVDDELKLLSILNTSKIEPQFYRSEDETMQDLRDLIEKLALKDPYFVAQCIVYSRCLGEGMRSINHLAAALLAPFISKTSWGKNFYSSWNKKEGRGGCIYRPDDMSEIQTIFHVLNKCKLTNAMKKGFANVIENLDSYSLAKYKKAVRDMANLCHPKSSNEILSALMHGETVSAATWETAQSKAGQDVADAVKSGELSEEKAEEVLAETKNENWKALLSEGKLGILAAIRNLRNMLINPDSEVIDLVCKLISNGEVIKKGKIMPYQLDLAWEVVKSNFDDSYSRIVLNSLEQGLESAIPNLKEILKGNNCVIVDCSGSMRIGISRDSLGRFSSTCQEKAALIAAMIAKATNADIIRFGSEADYFKYTPTNSIFEIAKQISSNDYGGTNLASAFDLITYEGRKYDRIFILSDTECNHGWQARAYKDLIRQVNSPYIYSIDLAAYGTQPLKSEGKVNYYYGYGYAMFDDITSKEFDPQMHIDKVRKVVINPR